jgi:hypothetical protein
MSHKSREFLSQLNRRQTLVESFYYLGGQTTGNFGSAVLTEPFAAFSTLSRHIIGWYLK